MKFRVRRMKPLCEECNKDLYMQETVTESQNIILVSDCCKLDVYPWKKIENEDHVPVAMITGEKISNKYVYEMLPDPCKKQEPIKAKPPPPPEPPNASISKRVSKKKGKKNKERKSKKTSVITTKKKKTYRVHEYEIHHSAEEVKERNLREAGGYTSESNSKIINSHINCI